VSGRDRYDSAGGLVQSREMCLRKGRQHSVEGENGGHKPFRTTGIAGAPLRLGAVLTDMTLDREWVSGR